MESRLLLRMARASRDLAAAAAALARQVAAKDATRASRAAAAPTASLPADVAAKDVPRASSASAALAAPLPARVAGADGNLAARVGSDNTDHLESCFQPFSYSCVDYMSDDEYDSIPDDAKLPTDKDLQSDEATWALYERWCKAFQKERDLVEMTRRFEIFKHYANQVHIWNNGLPADPKKAAAFSKKREKVKKLLSKGQDVSQFDEIYVPMVLGVFADGGDPDIIEWNKHLLKSTEERHDVKDECA